MGASQASNCKNIKMFSKTETTMGGNYHSITTNGVKSSIIFSF